MVWKKQIVKFAKEINITQTGIREKILLKKKIKTEKHTFHLKIIN